MYPSATSGSLNSPSRDSGKGNPLTCQGVGDGSCMPQLLFFFPPLVSVPLPSTSPKNKCFGEAPLPCGAGRRFVLPTVAGKYGGEICCDKGAKKYPTLLIRNTGYFFAPMRGKRLFNKRNNSISFSFYFVFFYPISMSF